MDALECLRGVVAASALIADADRDLFQDHEAGLVLKCFAIDSLAFHGTAAKLTAISELLVHGFVPFDPALSRGQYVLCREDRLSLTLQVYH